MALPEKTILEIRDRLSALATNPADLPREEESTEGYVVRPDGSGIAVADRSTQVADGSVTTAKIADRAVTNPKIADRAVTNAKIADNAIDTQTIINRAVTETKIHADSIATNLIQDDAVTSNKLAPTVRQSIADAAASGGGGANLATGTEYQAAASDVAATPEQVKGDVTPINDALNSIRAGSVRFERNYPLNLPADGETLAFIRSADGRTLIHRRVILDIPADDQNFPNIRGTSNGGGRYQSDYSGSFVLLPVAFQNTGSSAIPRVRVLVRRIVAIDEVDSPFTRSFIPACREQRSEDVVIDLDHFNGILIPNSPVNNLPENDIVRTGMRNQTILQIEITPDDPSGNILFNENGGNPYNLTACAPSSFPALNETQYLAQSDEAVVDANLATQAEYDAGNDETAARPSQVKGDVEEIEGRLSDAEHALHGYTTANITRTLLNGIPSATATYPLQGVTSLPADLSANPVLLHIDSLFASLGQFTQVPSYFRFAITGGTFAGGGTHRDIAYNHDDSGSTLTASIIATGDVVVTVTARNNSHAILNQDTVTLSGGAGTAVEAAGAGQSSLDDVAESVTQLADQVGQNTNAIGAAFTNSNISTQAQATSGTNNATLMTPLRTKQSIDANAPAVATQAAAEAGSGTGRMTSQRTLQAITAQRPKATTTQITAGTDDNAYVTPVLAKLAAETFGGGGGESESESGGSPPVLLWSAPGTASPYDLPDDSVSMTATHRLTANAWATYEWLVITGADALSNQNVAGGWWLKTSEIPTLNEVSNILSTYNATAAAWGTAQKRIFAEDENTLIPYELATSGHPDAIVQIWGVPASGGGGTPTPITNHDDLWTPNLLTPAQQADYPQLLNSLVIELPEGKTTDDYLGGEINITLQTSGEETSLSDGDAAPDIFFTFVDIGTTEATGKDIIWRLGTALETSKVWANEAKTQITIGMATPAPFVRSVRLLSLQSIPASGSSAQDGQNAAASGLPAHTIKVGTTPFGSGTDYSLPAGPDPSLSNLVALGPFTQAVAGETLVINLQPGAGTGQAGILYQASDGAYGGPIATYLSPENGPSRILLGDDEVHVSGTTREWRLFLWNNTAAAFASSGHSNTYSVIRFINNEEPLTPGAIDLHAALQGSASWEVGLNHPVDLEVFENLTFIVTGHNRDYRKRIPFDLRHPEGRDSIVSIVEGEAVSADKAYALFIDDSYLPNIIRSPGGTPGGLRAYVRFAFYRDTADGPIVRIKGVGSSSTNSSCLPQMELWGNRL